VREEFSGEDAKGTHMPTRTKTDSKKKVVKAEWDQIRNLTTNYER